MTKISRRDFIGAAAALAVVSIVDRGALTNPSERPGFFDPVRDDPRFLGLVPSRRAELTTATGWKRGTASRSQLMGNRRVSAPG
jgi:hypothetical protein